MKKRLRKKYGISLVVYRITDINYETRAVSLNPERRRLPRGFRLRGFGWYPPVPQLPEFVKVGQRTDFYTRPR